MLNPVLRREIRTLLRTWRSFTAISVYVLGLAAVAELFIGIYLSEMAYSGFNPSQSVSLYMLLFGLQLGFIILMVPTFAGGAISGERERQTLDLMLVTRMTTLDIIIGKLLSSLVLVVLMIVASLPVFGLVMYYGGVSLGKLLVMALFSIVTSAMVASIAIFFSTLQKRTIYATVLTFIILIFMSLGTFIIILVFGTLIEYMTDWYGISAYTVFAVLSWNPFMGFVSIVDSQIGTYTTVEMINSIGSGSGLPTKFPPLWLFNILVDVIITVGLTFASSYLVRPSKNAPRKTGKKRRGVEGA